jgi:hypothetical protein
MRIGVDSNAPPELLAKLTELGATFKPIGARPTSQGGGFGVESAAAFDSYVQMKARELGLDMANLPTGRGGGRGRGAGAADSTAAAGARGGAAGAAGAAAPADSIAGRGRAGGGGGATGLGAITRWTGGRSALAFEFIQAQRRRHVLISRMQELLKDFDMYIPSATGDIGLHAQTGHPTAVVQYKFEPQPQGRGGGGGRGGAGRAGGAGADTTAAGRAAGAAAQTPPAPFNPQPICAQICGNLYNDDLILSVAHQFQSQTDFHNRRPELRGQAP